ncbi:MAG: hypothetical protein V3T31_10820 [candidate division Zixibacteria bacterium]
MSGSTRSWIEIGSVVVLVGGLALVFAQIKQSTAFLFAHNSTT